MKSGPKSSEVDEVSISYLLMFMVSSATVRLMCKACRHTSCRNNVPRTVVKFTCWWKTLITVSNTCFNTHTTWKHLSCVTNNSTILRSNELRFSSHNIWCDWDNIESVQPSFNACYRWTCELFGKVMSSWNARTQPTTLVFGGGRFEVIGVEILTSMFTIVPVSTLLSTYLNQDRTDNKFTRNIQFCCFVKTTWLNKRHRYSLILHRPHTLSSTPLYQSHD